MADKLTISQLKDDFIKNIKQSGKATSTILAYGNDISQLAEFLNGKKINDPSLVSSALIDQYKDHLGNKSYTNKSISRKLNSTRTFFRYLVSKGLVSENPTNNVTHPKIKNSPPRILSKMEYRALRDVCSSDPRLYAIVELFLQTGIRISELANLVMDDIKKDALSIMAYESHPEREVPLNQASKKALETYLKIRPNSKNKHVFLTKNGKPFLIRNIRSAVERQFKLADIKDSTVNDLRHTFIAHQLKDGTPLIVVSKIVGHKRLSTTEKYLKFIESTAEKDSMKLQEL